MAIPNLSTAVSSLQVSQRALTVIGNNLANANTEGYHRQEAQLANRVPVQIGNVSFGRGVDFVDIRQIRSDVVESNFTFQSSDNGRLDSSLRVLTRLESRIAIESSSPLTRIEGLFNELEQLSTRLDDPAFRNAVATEAATLTDEFNRLHEDLAQLQLDIDQEIRGKADEANNLAQRISQLNVEIARSVNAGVTPADLQDQRDQAINELATLIDLRVQEGNAGQATVIASNSALVIGSESVEIAASIAPNADAAIVIDATDTVMPLTGGELTGLVEFRNGLLQDIRTQLDELATGLIAEFDALHTEGVGTAGGFTRLDSQRPVSSIDVALSEAGLDFPPTAGDLFIGVTDTSTGERSIVQLPPIDPGSLTARQLAANITSTVPNVSAVADSQTGGITILAEPGFEFEFTGGTDDSPVQTATATPPLANPAAITLGGAYTGSTNGSLNFAFNQDGTVGETAGLELVVTDAVGTTLASLNVGSGYSIGDELEVIDGVTVAVGAGDVSNVESFQSDLVGDPDTSNILRALGLNTFFTGATAKDIGITQEILNDSGRIATSRTREVSDSSNLQRLVNVRELQVFASSTQDLRAFSTSIIADVGLEVQTTTELKETADTLTERIEEERASISGVDPNEELVELIKFQRQFEIAARFISTINSTLDELINVIR